MPDDFQALPAPQPPAPLPSCKDRYAEVSFKKPEDDNFDRRILAIIIGVAAAAFLVFGFLTSSSLRPPVTVRVAPVTVSVAVPTKPSTPGVWAEKRILAAPKLEGTWVATSFVLNGDENVAEVTVTFDAHGSWRMNLPDSQWSGKAGYKPTFMSFTVLRGPGDTGSKIGVCKLDDDILKICVKWLPVDGPEPWLEGGERLTDFTAEKGSGRMLLVMKRSRRDDGR
jgi:hypothetical protein